MEIVIPAETLEGALSRLKNFVHKPGGDTSLLTMSATHVTANKDNNTVTFVGNNPSQKISFSVDAKVTTGGEALVSVADALTALSTISDKSQDVRVALEGSEIQIHSKTVSVSVPVFDLASATMTPKAPSEAEGGVMSVTVDAEELPTLFTRALPGSIESRWPKILMWVDSGEFCLMSLSEFGASFASVSGAESSGATDLILWDSANLRRIMGLAAAADTVTIAQDLDKKGEPKSEFTVTVKAKDTTFVVEQALEQVQDAYVQARNKLAQKGSKVFDESVTTVTVKGADIVRAMESAERVRVIGRDKANAQTTYLSIESGLLEVSLADETFSEEIGSAKTGGSVPRAVGVNAKITLAMLNALGAEAKVTVHLPEGNPDGRTSFAMLSCQDSDLDSSVKALPATGFWGITSFRVVRR